MAGSPPAMSFLRCETMSLMQDRLSALAPLALGGYMFWKSASFSEAGRIFPRLIAGLLILAALVIIARSFLGRAVEGEHQQQAMTGEVSSWFDLYQVMGLTLVYVLAIPYAGFYLATLVFIPVTTVLSGLRRPGVIAATTIGFLLVIWVLARHVFYVPLPAGVLLPRLGLL